MTTAEYRAADAVNFSSLKHILTSPAHYQAAMNEKREETPAMLLGTLTHSVVLEGKAINDIAAIKPDGLSLATKEGKAWKAEWAEDKPIISLPEAQSIKAMAESIACNPNAAAMLKGCFHRETPFFSDLRGVKCKALIDAYGTDGKEWVICDLKTTDDASPDSFARKVANLHYDMQAAFYSQILANVYQIETRPFWYWIVVQKSAPYTCVVYSADEWMDSGESKVEAALERVKECRESSSWPQPWAGIQQLPKPKWA